MCWFVCGECVCGVFRVGVCLCLCECVFEVDVCDVRVPVFGVCLWC